MIRDLEYQTIFSEFESHLSKLNLSSDFLSCLLFTNLCLAYRPYITFKRFCVSIPINAFW